MTCQVRTRVLASSNLKCVYTRLPVLERHRYADSMRLLEELKNGVDMMFRRIGCDMREMAGIAGHGGVTEHNIMQYLGVIEQRGNEILQLYAATQAGNEPLTQALLSAGASEPGTPGVVGGAGSGHAHESVAF